MTQPIELHGKEECPFAWRTRLCAFEKGVPFEYIAFDAPEPDPRSARDNPERRSPLLVHADFRITESGVIAQYIDEAFAGRALVPREVKERARLRVDVAELAKLEADLPVGATLSADAQPRVARGFQQLEQKLADGRVWLGGAEPRLSDLMLWPFLAVLRLRIRMAVPDGLGRVNAYLERAFARESYLATRPPWAR